MSFPENVEMFSDLTPKRNLKRQRGDYDTVPIPTYGELNTARPTWEDMIIAYSTIPGMFCFIVNLLPVGPLCIKVETKLAVLGFKPMPIQMRQTKYQDLNIS